jgi:hypothetical protein
MGTRQRQQRSERGQARAEYEYALAQAWRAIYRAAQSAADQGLEGAYEDLMEVGRHVYNLQEASLAGRRRRAVSSINRAYPSDAQGKLGA